MRVPGRTPQINLRLFFKRFQAALVMRGLGLYNCAPDVAAYPATKPRWTLSSIERAAASGGCAVRHRHRISAAVILNPGQKNRVFEIDTTSRAARINAGVPHGLLDPGVVLDRAIFPLAPL
jgi:hypothetical protein